MNSICPALLINHTGSITVSECLKGGNTGRWELLTGAGGSGGMGNARAADSALPALQAVVQGQGWG